MVTGSSRFASSNVASTTIRPVPRTSATIEAFSSLASRPGTMYAARRTGTAPWGIPHTPVSRLICVRPTVSDPIRSPITAVRSGSAHATASTESTSANVTTSSVRPMMLPPGILTQYLPGMSHRANPATVRGDSTEGDRMIPPFHLNGRRTNPARWEITLFDVAADSLGRRPQDLPPGRPGAPGARGVPGRRRGGGRPRGDRDGRAAEPRRGRARSGDADAERPRCGPGDYPRVSPYPYDPADDACRG